MLGETNAARHEREEAESLVWAQVSPQMAAQQKLILQRAEARHKQKLLEV